MGHHRQQRRHQQALRRATEPLRRRLAIRHRHQPHVDAQRLVAHVRPHARQGRWKIYQHRLHDVDIRHRLCLGLRSIEGWRGAVHQVLRCRLGPTQRPSKRNPARLDRHRDDQPVQGTLPRPLQNGPRTHTRRPLGHPRRPRRNRSLPSLKRLRFRNRNLHTSRRRLLRLVNQTSPFCEAKGGRGERSETQGVHTVIRLNPLGSSRGRDGCPIHQSRTLSLRPRYPPTDARMTVQYRLN